MVRYPFFHELLLLALLWLLVISYRAWRRGSAALDPAQPTSAQPAPRHFTDPQPFVGLITRPLCVACEQAPTLSSLSAPPPLIVGTRGRPRHVDTRQHYCPTPGCQYYGWVGRGNIRANGHPGGGTWRQLQCIACRTSF